MLDRTAEQALQLQHPIRSSTIGRNDGQGQNIASVTARDESLREVQDSDDESVPVKATLSKLEVWKTATTGVLIPGEPITYVITVLNAGDQELHNITVVENVPPGLTYLRSGFGPGVRPSRPGGIYDPDSRTLKWEFPAIAGGESGVVSFQVRVNNDVPPGTIVGNEVKVMADGFTEPVIDGVGVRVNLAKLRIRKDADKDKVGPGEEVRYTLSYWSSGNTPLTGVRLTDVVPDYTKFSWVDEQGNYDEATRTITWSVGDLARQAGSAQGGFEEVSFGVVIDNEVPNGAWIINTARIVSDQTEPEESNRMVTAFIPPEAPAIYLEKSVDKTLAQEEDVLTLYPDLHQFVSHRPGNQCRDYR
ncbi:MAG: DUF11 domain-containing protein [bacterium]|nr:DUF11 domain-containing protein [bacterium]